MKQPLQRTKPLVVKRGLLETTLQASDVNLLIEGAQVLAQGAQNAHDMRPIDDDELREHLRELLQGHVLELLALAKELASASPTPLGPPLDLSRAKAQLLRQVISDLGGYQRRDLTPELRELRRILSEH